MKRKTFPRWIITIGITGLVIASLGVTAAVAMSWGSCPKVSGPCPYPGICRSYYDSNSNGICDFSEEAPSAATPSAQPAPVEPASVATTAVSDAKVAATPAPKTTVTSEEAKNDVVAAIEEQAIAPASPPDLVPGDKEDVPPAQPEIDSYDSSPAISTAVTNYSWTAFFASPWLGIVILTALLIAATLQHYFFPLPFLRWIFLFIGVVFLGFFHQCFLCPVGAFTSITNFFTGRTVNYFILALLGLPIVFTIFFGRIYCGSLCPMGGVQALLFRLGIWLKLTGHEQPTKLTKGLRLGKYLVLGGVVASGFLGGAAIFCELDPFGFLFNFSGTIISAALLVGVLTWSTFSSRPWCRYICPYGALLGIINKIRHGLASKFGWRLSPWISPDACNGCRACGRKCPTNAIEQCQINYAECIDCGECVTACRKKAID